MHGDLVNAERGYREAIKIGYCNHGIFTNLGVICKNSGRIEEAILLYKKAIEISPNEPDAYSNLGNLYQSLGNFMDAVAFSTKSLELNANNPGALISLGWSQKELGNLEQALSTGQSVHRHHSSTLTTAYRRPPANVSPLRRSQLPAGS